MKISTLSLITAVAISAGTLQASAHLGLGHLGRHGSSAHSNSPQTKKPTQPSGSTRQNTAANRIAQNPALAARLKPLLPAGTNLQTAASGFKNQGQFIAALHVSRNLHIPFDQLKAKMTGPDHESLGHAIQDLRPNLSSKTSKTEEKIAKLQTKEDEDAAQTRQDKDDQKATVATKR